MYLRLITIERKINFILIFIFSYKPNYNTARLKLQKKKKEKKNSECTQPHHRAKEIKNETTKDTNSLARLARRRRERKRKTEMAPVSKRLVAV